MDEPNVVGGEADWAKWLLTAQAKVVERGCCRMRIQSMQAAGVNVRGCVYRMYAGTEVADADAGDANRTELGLGGRGV